jgi:hypothetical protein
LETTRQYGEERRGEHGETGGLRAAHAEHYCDCALASALRANIVGPKQMDAGRRLVADWENLLVAMNQAVETEGTDLAPTAWSRLSWPAALAFPGRCCSDWPPMR